MLKSVEDAGTRSESSGSGKIPGICPLATVIGGACPDAHVGNGPAEGWGGNR